MKPNIYLILFITVMGMSWSTEGWATSKYRKAFVARYPHTAKTVLDKCATCHKNSPMDEEIVLNPYGRDIHVWMVEHEVGIDDALKGIEPDDSDKDGLTNIEEINNLTGPGNPQDPKKDS